MDTCSPSLASPATRALLAAASLGSTRELARALRDGADPAFADSRGMSALMRAIARGSMAHFSMLLPLSDPLAKSYAGDTPLMLAIHHRQPAMADRLIPLSDLFARDALGSSILCLCAIHGLAHTAERASRAAHKLCPDAAERLSRPDAHGMGPLMWASKRLDLPMASMLAPLDDARRSDARGRTALIHALCSAHMGTAELGAACARLLAPLSCALARDLDGLSAADHARQARLPEIALWIETVGHAESEALALESCLAPSAPAEAAPAPARSRRL